MNVMCFISWKPISVNCQFHIHIKVSMDLFFKLLIKLNILWMKNVLHFKCIEYEWAKFHKNWAIMIFNDSKACTMHTFFIWYCNSTVDYIHQYKTSSELSMYGLPTVYREIFACVLFLPFTSSLSVGEFKMVNSKFPIFNSISL